MRNLFRLRSIVDLTTAFVDGGYGRALDGIEAEIRPEIEQKYANEWNESGPIQRWQLSRKINKEISALVAERSKHISPRSLF